MTPEYFERLQELLIDSPAYFEAYIQNLWGQLSPNLQQKISGIDARLSRLDGGAALTLSYPGEPLIMASQICRQELLRALYRTARIELVLISSGVNLHRLCRRPNGFWAIEELHPTSGEQSA